MNSFVLFCVLLLKIQFLCAQDNSNQEEDPTLCTCNLKIDSCDVNCCCDPDCTETDRIVFSTCINEIYSDDPKYCVQPGSIVFNNSRQTAYYDEGGLLCIYYDNYKERNFFKIPEEIKTTEQFEDRRKLLKSVHTFEESQPLPLNETYNVMYKVGDPIFAIGPSGSLIELGLPRPLLTEFCTEPAPIGFMEDSINSCFGALVLSKETCESTQFSAVLYYKNISLLKRPEFLTSQLNALKSLEAAVASLKPEDLTPIQHSRTYLNLDTGVEETLPENIPDLPAPVWNDVEKSCSNIVHQVEYQFTVNSTLGFVAVFASFALGTVRGENTAIFRQQFTSKFFWETETLENSFRRSGNPGYQVGQPVMAGILVENSTQSEDGTLVTAYAIELSRDPNEWLTLIGSNDCSSNERVPILFGHNMQSGCLIRIRSDITDAECEDLRLAALAALVGPTRNRVGGYANASVDLAGDWVEIFVVNPPPTVAVNAAGRAPGSCPNMVLGLNIEIIFAKTGAFHEPQAKILGVRYVYHKPLTIQVECVGPYCQPGSENLGQTIPVVSTVTFYDVTQPAEPAVAAVPTFDAKFPNDFFYPFTGGAEGMQEYGVLFMCLLLMLVFSEHIL